MKPITCEEVITRFDPYFEGTLSDQEEFALDRHLDRCDACTAKLNALIESQERFHLTQQEETELLRSLRASYTLRPGRERRGVEKIVADVQSLWSESERIAWAAADRSEIDEIRERIGTNFEKRGPIRMHSYTGELYVRDRYSAFLEFRKAGQLASELNGKTMTFYLVGKQNPTEAPNLLSQIIHEGIVVIDFSKFGISIEEYAKVGFTLYVNESTVIEGRLGDA